MSSFDGPAGAAMKVKLYYAMDLAHPIEITIPRYMREDLSQAFAKYHAGSGPKVITYPTPWPSAELTKIDAEEMTVAVNFENLLVIE